MKTCSQKFKNPFGNESSKIKSKDKFELRSGGGGGGGRGERNFAMHFAGLNLYAPSLFNPRATT